MKTLTIYERKVLERTGYKKFAFKETTQISIFYDNKEYKNHYDDINNDRLKIKFAITLETRSTKELEKYMSKLGYSNADKFKRETLERIFRKED